jgi:hypothetical protein
MPKTYYILTSTDQIEFKKLVDKVIRIKDVEIKGGLSYIPGLYMQACLVPKDKLEKVKMLHTNF